MVNMVLNDPSNRKKRRTRIAFQSYYYCEGHRGHARYLISNNEVIHWLGDYNMLEGGAALGSEEGDVNLQIVFDTF
jgi:hypothetical protein